MSIFNSSGFYLWWKYSGESPVFSIQHASRPLHYTSCIHDEKRPSRGVRITIQAVCPSFLMPKYIGGVSPSLFLYVGLNSICVTNPTASALVRCCFRIVSNIKSRSMYLFMSHHRRLEHSALKNDYKMYSRPLKLPDNGNEI